MLPAAGHGCKRLADDCRELPAMVASTRPCTDVLQLLHRNITLLQHPCHATAVHEKMAFAEERAASPHMFVGVNPGGWPGQCNVYHA